MDFKIQFGKARIAKRKHKNIKDPQNLWIDILFIKYNI